MNTSTSDSEYTPKKSPHNEILHSRSIEALIFMGLFSFIFGGLALEMGAVNLVNTIMRTAHDLLMNTVFFIMGITVISGALGKLMIEFGVVRLMEFLLAPLMRPLFNLPGVASLGALMTFFSDNPAIISLARDRKFASYFKKAELISLCNFGTAFGMGLIVMAFMFGLGFFKAAFIGLIGAVTGATISTRLMQRLIRDAEFNSSDEPTDNNDTSNETICFKSEGGVFLRFLNAVLDGGKQGVDLALAIIPGVLIISTFVMIITFGPLDPIAGYKGVAYEGVPVLPWLAGLAAPIFKGLFGFNSPELIAFPITSLGAVGAALSLIRMFLAKGIVGPNEIAVFTAMGMCWSGYLSTHTAMLDALNQRHLTSRALFAHTIGGLAAGIFAHFLYLFVSRLG
ncbi:MAG: hypothetical protein CVV64_04250 [Candidatus Wallbacteria bacterium HGW-Wallbacteria-1]|jgi:hypothetical protein|uniref:Nucleoside transporter/FeoB GTPase Gate domain-containing protein n=1 Tax=Candidatus Wallbacteria bacterium HGW-Wallbacteria-1 TaxID=2013854 RepID=A0A2N1PRM8_9BACT|nr:MAG: hypothetical protein CVV64_04250 [Candidatus Wallbacteria bacterium HGW-Wallbacteria-1]